MKIDGCVALVTGANRGLGQAFVRGLRAAGAGKVYATARNPSDVREPGVTPVALDITKPNQVAAAAGQCGDITLLINNAGIADFTPLLAAPELDGARAEMETNYFGTLAMCRAFAPALKANGGGALVNVLSVVSLFNVPMQGSYSASKAAGWSLTKGIRFELKVQGTLVVGVYAGYIDTDMTSHLAVPKSRPEDVVARVLAGVEAGDEEVFADRRAEEVRDTLAADRNGLDPGLQQAWDKLNPR